MIKSNVLTMTNEVLAEAFEIDARSLRHAGKFDIANWAHEMAHAYRNGWGNLVTMGYGLHMFRGLRYSAMYMCINSQQVIRDYTPE